MIAAAHCGKLKTSAKPREPPIRFPASNPKAVAKRVMTIKPLIIRLAVLLSLKVEIDASAISRLETIPILCDISIKTNKEKPENRIAQSNSYLKLTPATVVVVMVPGPIKALVTIAAGPMSLKRSKKPFLFPVLLLMYNSSYAYNFPTNEQVGFYLLNKKMNTDTFIA